ncbi:MAG: hypothetical protein AB7Q17_13120, partial [Phycisphaerae bacterium]
PETEARHLMHSEPKALLRKAILQVIPHLQKLSGESLSPYQVCTKTGDQQWQGEAVLRLDTARLFSAANDYIRRASEPFMNSFLTQHSGYNGFMRFCGFIGDNYSRDSICILCYALAHLWTKYETFDLNAAAIDSLVSEFETFVDTASTRFVFRTQLVNFCASLDRFPLPHGLLVRRMTDREVSGFSGGWFQLRAGGQSHSVGIHEFCVEGTITLSRCTEAEITDVRPEAQVKVALDKAVLSFRTFKRGSVGYGMIHFAPVTFCPVMVGSIGYGDAYIPIGEYRLETDEIGEFSEHATRVYAMTEPSMQMACSRLADSGMRTKPVDRLVDAVIGMEALLLAGLRSEDRRSELKLRFALHYSTLFTETEERRRAFRLAKDLYDLRSRIVHGSAFARTVLRVGDEKLNLSEAANRACEALRLVVKKFLPRTERAPYKQPEFWESAYFGIHPNQ